MFIRHHSRSCIYSAVEGWASGLAGAFQVLAVRVCKEDPMIKFAFDL